MHFLERSLLLLFILCCLSCQHRKCIGVVAISTDSTLSTTAATTRQHQSHSCGSIANSESTCCFEDSVPFKVETRETDTAVLRCIIRNLNKQVVTWMRNDGRDIPMTIGSAVFTPDSRVSLDNSVPDEWNLVIRRVEMKDSGDYLCQVNGKIGLMARAYTLVVEESRSPNRPFSPDDGNYYPPGDKRFQNDDREARNGAKSNNVRIDAEDTVFEGTLYFPLTCAAKFASRDAKASSGVAIEWYHQGMRQTVNVTSMDISMSWTDGDRAVSVLTIYRVEMRHSGDWVCLKRPSEIVGVMETATHALTVLGRQSSSSIAKSSDQKSKPDALQLASAGFGVRSASNDKWTGGDSRKSASLGAPSFALLCISAAALLTAQLVSVACCVVVR